MAGDVEKEINESKKKESEKKQQLIDKQKRDLDEFNKEQSIIVTKDPEFKAEFYNILFNSPLSVINKNKINNIEDFKKVLSNFYSNHKKEISNNISYLRNNTTESYKTYLDTTRKHKVLVLLIKVIELSIKLSNNKKEREFYYPNEKSIKNMFENIKNKIENNFTFSKIIEKKNYIGDLPDYSNIKSLYKFYIIDNNDIIVIDEENENPDRDGFISNLNGYITPGEKIHLNSNTINNIKIGESIKKKRQNKKNNLLNIGQINILKEKLINDNILAIRDLKNYRYKNLSNKKVSDNMIEILLNLSNNNIVSNKDYNTLDDNEKTLYNLIIKISKLNKTKNFNDIETTKNNIKNKYNLIIGEIESGNNNIILLKQLKDILEELHHMKLINSKNLKEHYNEIYNNYFK